MLRQPPVLNALKINRRLNVLHNFELKALLSVLIPRSLQVFAMVRIAAKEPSMRLRSLVIPNSAAYIEVTVDNVTDLVNDVL